MERLSIKWESKQKVRESILIWRPSWYGESEENGRCHQYEYEIDGFVVILQLYHLPEKYDCCRLYDYILPEYVESINIYRKDKDGSVCRIASFPFDGKNLPYQIEWRC